MTEDAGRVGYRLGVVQREAPQTLLVSGAAFLLITLLNSQVGPTMPVPVLVVNVLTGALLIIGGRAIRGHRVPPAAAPWIMATGALVLVLIGLVEVWESPDAVGFLYLIMIMLIYPLLTLAWLPAVSVAVPMFIGCVVVAVGQFGEAAPDWIIASIAAVVVGMSLLWLRMRTVIELADQSALVGRLATRDRLTGALNRHGVQERISDLVALAARHQQPVFAVFLDVDGLKAVNDTHGHASGDAVLVATADAIRAALRATDLVGRWGGDEFVVLGMGEVEHADALRDRITDSVLADGVDPAMWDGGVSVGIATAALAGMDIEALIRSADADMYARRGVRRDPEGAA
jgi:diguanylate cyclase (GGDEF)-like protein